MADYKGPATLHNGDHHIELEVELTTFDDGLTYSWDGRGITTNVAHGLAALDVKVGELEFPNGLRGPVHLPHAALNPYGPGVLVRIHGGGKPAPYAK